MAKKSKDRPVSFRAWRDETDKKREINSSSWFGLILGLILTAAGLINALTHVGAAAVAYWILAGVGAVCFLLGGFYPIPLRYPMRLMQKVGNFIGKYVLRVLMVPIYVLMAVPALFLRRVTAKKYEFRSWDGSAPASASFLPYKEEPYKKASVGFIGTLNNLFFFLAQNKLLFLLPIVVILIVIGLVSFFISANSVFTFIYTLF